MLIIAQNKLHEHKRKMGIKKPLESPSLGDGYDAAVVQVLIGQVSAKPHVGAETPKEIAWVFAEDPHNSSELYAKLLRAEPGSSYHPV
jgi:hypothetical protein